MTADDLELLRGMWIAFADDLARWARAFGGLDPDSESAILRLAEAITTRAATLTDEVP